MVWWKRNKLRLIQTNLRDTDADMDVDLLIAGLKDLSANTLQFNTGGIMAFYPTGLEFHYRNPYLKGDLIGEVIEKCHQNGIKFIARFDFSKAHVSVFNDKPDWFYRSLQGNYINYNDMVHTCVNGYYQSEYSLKILKEVLARYQVDGIFFNMFGYQTTDYSGNYHGICHCENCKKRFKEMYHLELPKTEATDDPVYIKYVEFKEITTRELLEKIHKVVKEIDPNLPISTYHDYMVDMVRKESNTAVDRPYPIWLYSASENVKSVEDTWDDKLVSNCSINAVDMPYRFMGVSKHLIRLRLYQNIANGSGLDFCINGVFEGYPDRENFDAVKEVFEFHKKNEAYFGSFQSVADIALIKPEVKVLADVESEYLGIFKMLKERHIQFDVICQENLEERVEGLKRYLCVIVPDYRILLNEKIAAAMQEPTTNWMLTGAYPERGCEEIYRIIGGKLIDRRGANRSAYFLTQDKQVFLRFAERDWIFVDFTFAGIKFDEGVLPLLPFIKPARFGPPERCGGYSVSDEYGAGIKAYKNMNVVSVPWEIGKLYQTYGYEDHKNILLDLLDYVTDQNYILTTNAPMDVELILNKYDDGTYLLQLLNLSGYNGSTFYKPNPIYGIDISIRNVRSGVKVIPLDKGGEPACEEHPEGLIIHVAQLDHYLAYTIR